MRTEPDAGGGGRPVLGSVLHAEIGRGRGALGRQELTDLTRELAVMLAAGQDLDHALRFVVETAGTAKVAAASRSGCATPCGTAARLPPRSRSPRSFPPLFVGLVRAGEAGGTLAATLDSLATLLERQRSLEVWPAPGVDLPRRSCWRPPSAPSRCC